MRTTFSRIFLHGFLGSRQCCPYQKDCWAIQLPGHGSEPISSDTTFDSFIDKILSKIDRPVELVGYSMGGRIALKMALKRPELFSSICILSADPSGFGSEEKTISWLESMSFESFIHRWYSQPLFIGVDVRAKLESTRLHNPKNLIMALSSFSKSCQGDLWNNFGPIASKLHYMCGSLDTKYVGIASRLKTMYPALRVTVVQGVGHSFYEILNEKGVKK